MSPNGARAVFAARGEIVTVPAEKGDPRNLTLTPGVMEREPQWSPDGRTIAYLSDESGEYALHLRSQNGDGDVVKIPLKQGFYSTPRFSPAFTSVTSPLSVYASHMLAPFFALASTVAVTRALVPSDAIVIVARGVRLVAVANRLG